jgi:hypothetical protein
MKPADYDPEAVDLPPYPWRFGFIGGIRLGAAAARGVQCVSGSPLYCLWKKIKIIYIYIYIYERYFLLPSVTKRYQALRSVTKRYVTLFGGDRR